ncbi:MAG: PAS domain S-box protein [Acidobacteriota bacterium]|nr:PAS domain S-box protein [Acidobacteriota bacterium]
MKTLFSETSANRFPLFLLIVAILFTGTGFIWFILHIFGYDNMQSTAAHQHSVWFVTAIITILVVFLATCLKTIRIFHKTYETFLINNAERKQTEEALQQSEARFRELLENANDLFYTGDLQGNFTSLNKVGELITGYTQEEFCRMNYADIIAPDHLENANQKFTHKLTGGVPTNYELEIITKSGQRVALDLSNRIVFQGDKPIGVQGIGRDITARWRAEKILRDSEARYRVVTESASDAIITIDKEHTILFVNSAAEKIFGYAVDEMLGNNLFMLMPEHLRAPHAAGMKRYNETNKRNISWQGVELPGLHKDGHEIPLEITFGEINSDGKHLFTAVIRDITERKRVKEELQKNLSLLTSTLEATANGILVVNLSNDIVTFNKKFVEMWDIPEDVAGIKNSTQIIAWVSEQLKDPEDLIKKTKQSLKQPEVKDFSILELADGRIYERHSHPQILDGKVVGQVLSFRDITVSKRTEEKLSEGKEWLQAIFDASRDGIIIEDGAQVAYINKSYTQLLGYNEPEELTGKQISQLLSTEDVERMTEFGQRRLRDELVPSIYNFKTKRKDKTLVETEGAVSTVVIGGKKYIMTVVRDVTKRKRAEEELQKNLSLLTSTFEATNDGILVVDRNNKIVTYNQKFIDMVQIPDEIIKLMDNGKVIDCILDRLSDAENFLDTTKQLVLHPETQYFDVVEFKSGKVFERHSLPRILDGEVIGRVISFRDITERKLAEEKLNKNERFLRAVLENLTDGIVACDAEGTLTFFNKATHKFHGLPQISLAPEKWSEYYSLYNADAKTKMQMKDVPLYRALQEGSVENLELVIKPKNGLARTVISSGQALFDESNQKLGAVVVMHDITERKKAVGELQKNLSLLTSTLEATGDGILVVDLDNTIVTCNRQYFEIWQISDEIIKSMDYAKVTEYISKQLINADDFINTTKGLTAKPGIKDFDLLEFKDGRIYERHSHPQILDGKVVGQVASFRDITERKRAENTLRESESLLAAAQRITHSGSWELDLSDLENLDNNEVRWSDETYRVYGYEPGQIEVSNEVFYNAAHPDDRTRIGQALIEAIEQRKNYNIEHRIILPDGSERILHCQAVLIFDNRADKPIKLLGTVQDITERKRAIDALLESENKFRMLVENTSEGLLQVDNDDRTQFINNRLCEMVGYSADELINKIWTQMLLDDEGRDLIGQANGRRRKGISDRYETKLRKKSGELFWVIIGGAPIVDAEGKIIGSMGVFSDITEKKRAEEQLLHDAFHDGLTGLANRALFMDHLRMTIERGKIPHSNSYAVLFLDFDRFKVINDSLGHAEGDNLLKHIARQLESLMRTGDLVARLGGDEFVILLSEMLEEGDAVQVAERIQNSLKNPFDLSGNEVFVSVSIGIALSTAGHKHAEDMLRDADIAMYRAKAKGRAQYQIFDQSMHEHASQQLSLEIEMRRALERQEFLIHYQPIINLEDESLVGFEALVRWKHPERGMISPFVFIPAAEENGLILPLGNWILRESCRQLRCWQDVNSAASRLTVSVNLSCKQFLQFDLTQQIDSTLRATGLDPRCLKLEITESHIMENSEMAVVIMNHLHALGVEISLDDFGTGYSSLSYLHSLPVDYLKVDRSFISRMTDSKENSEIVFTIIKLAHNLKMKVVAEGIETAEQLAQLKNLNCEYGQGYIFLKPLEAAEAENFIKQNAENFFVHCQSN